MAIQTGHGSPLSSIFNAHAMLCARGYAGPYAFWRLANESSKNFVAAGMFPCFQAVAPALFKLTATCAMQPCVSQGARRNVAGVGKVHGQPV